MNKGAFAGWIAAAGLGGVLLAGGFQGAQDKLGVVDLNKAVQDSQMGKKNKETLETAVSARRGVIDFMTTHRVLTVEQSQKIKTLTLKSPLSESEKQDLEKTKQDVISASKNFDALNQKASPTEDDRKLLQEYNLRAQSTGGLVQEWSQAFGQELDQLQQQLVADAVKRADTAIHDISKKDGYTVVYSSPGAAVYGANDLTEAVTKALDAGK